MIVEREYYVKLSEIGKENKITNKEKFIFRKASTRYTLPGLIRIKRRIRRFFIYL